MINKYALYFIWVISMIASSVALYLLEVQHWAISHLSWYQLICMIPIALMSGMAAWHGFLEITRYLFPLSITGMCLAIYQFFLQRYCAYPIGSRIIEICTPSEGDPISFYFRYSLSALSAIAFLLINIIFFIIIRKKK